MQHIPGFQRQPTVVERRDISDLTDSALSAALRAYTLEVDRISRAAAKSEGIDIADGWRLDIGARVWAREVPAMPAQPDGTGAAAPAVVDRPAPFVVTNTLRGDTVVDVMSDGTEQTRPAPAPGQPDDAGALPVVDPVNAAEAVSDGQ